MNKASPRGAKPERAARVYQPSYRIYVGNLPWDVDDSRLEQVFSEHGKVASAKVVYDRDSGRSRGFGFVTMASEAEMNDAIANLDGQVSNSAPSPPFSLHFLCLNYSSPFHRKYIQPMWEYMYIYIFFCLVLQSLDGRAIRVNIAEERPRRNAF